MEVVRKYIFLVAGAICILFSCVFFCLSFHQTHNEEYSALQGRRQLDTAIAKTYDSYGRQGGLAGLFADAYGDLFRENAKKSGSSLKNYQNKAIGYGVSGGILTILGAGCITWQIKVAPKSIKVLCKKARRMLRRTLRRLGLGKGKHQKSVQREKI